MPFLVLKLNLSESEVVEVLPSERTGIPTLFLLLSRQYLANTVLVSKSKFIKQASKMISP